MSDTTREIEIQDLSSIMSLESGRNVIAKILNYTNIDDDIFDQDPVTHARNAGRREIGIWLRNEIIAAAPDQYLRMMKEKING
jgi:hypothetical protein